MRDKKQDMTIGVVEGADAAYTHAAEGIESGDHTNQTTPPIPSSAGSE